MAELVAHFLLLSLLIIGFLIVPLLLGRYLFRPKLPTPEKDAIYECGEPTIGSSYIQFDLRFYVVALLFIIFDVEIAFFFPWSTIYGQATQLADTRIEAGHTGEVIASDSEPSPKIVPVRFQPTSSGFLLGHSSGADLDEISVEVINTIPKDNIRKLTLRWISGKLDGQSFRMQRFNQAEKQLTLRDELPSLPKPGAKFIIDDFSKYNFAEKTLEVHWDGQNKGAVSRVSGYDLKSETLTLEEPLPKTPDVRDGFVLINPLRIALTEKTLSLPPGTISPRDAISPADGMRLTQVSFYDILIFFAVLLVGFAYVWKRGDLDWVRAVSEKAKQASPRPQALLSRDSQKG